MTFKQAHDNHGIKSIRLARWHEGDKLELPVIVDGKRTIWCYLHDPHVLPSPQPVMSYEMMDDTQDWLIAESYVQI